MRRLCGILFALIFCHSALLAEYGDIYNLELLHSEPISYGYVDSYVISGNYAFLATHNAGLRVMDLSNLEAITEVGHCYFDFSRYYQEVSEMTIYENYIFCFCSEDRIILIDISDPCHPFCVENVYSEFNNISSFAIDNNTLYCTRNCEICEIMVIDISNPLNPTLTNSFSTEWSNWRITINSGYAYILKKVYVLPECNESIIIVNLSDMESLQIVSEISGGQNEPFWGYSVEGNRLYLKRDNLGFTIYDIRTPQMPVYIGSTNTDPGFYDYERNSIEIIGNYAYVSRTHRRFNIIDISDPTRPSIVNTYVVSGYRDFGLFNSFLFLCGSDKSFSILDITNPAEPTMEIDYQYNTRLYQRMAAKDSTLYVMKTFDSVIDESDGVSVFDISSQGIPELACEYRGVFFIDMHIAGDYAYLIPFGQIVDLNSPERFEVIGNLHSDTSNRFFRTFAHSENYLFSVDDLSGKVLAYSLSNPADPQLIGEVPFQRSEISQIMLCDNTLCMMRDYGSTFVVVDISDPSNPVITNNDLDLSCTHATQNENHLMTYNEENNILSVYDLTDPYNPEPIYSFNMPLPDNFHFSTMFSRGPYIFLNGSLGSFKSDLYIVNIADSENPFIAASFEDYFEFRDIEIYDDVFYLSAVSTFYAFDYSNVLSATKIPVITIPDHFSINRTFPNPFNPTLNVEVSLPQMGNLEVSVFNLLGQQVATLANQTRQAGTHTFTFDGSNMASGIYFVKASLPGQVTQMQKVVLMK